MLNEPGPPSSESCEDNDNTFMLLKTSSLRSRMGLLALSLGSLTFSLTSLTASTVSSNGTIEGVKFNDLNRDGVKDVGEPGIEDWFIFIDLNADGVWDDGVEPWTLTGPDGSYSFDVPPGEYVLGEFVEVPWFQSLSPTPPGGAGYQWQDSLNSSLDPVPVPAYDFEDISGTGTPVLDNADDGMQFVNLPFDFIFYGETYDSFYISTNGFITFDDTGDSGCCSGDIGSNDDESPNNLIALFWEDLDPGDGGTIYWESRTAPDRMIVQYDDVEPFSSDGFIQAFTGQIILYANGTIDLNYLYFNEDAPTELAHAGLEGPETDDPDDFQFLPIVISDGSYWQDEITIRIVPSSNTITVESGETISEADFGNFYVEPATIAGTKWLDVDDDGELGPGDTRMANVTIYIDANNNGVLDDGEWSQLTDSNGDFEFSYDGTPETFLPPGSYVVREVNSAVNFELVPFSSTQLVAYDWDEGALVGVDPVTLQVTFLGFPNYGVFLPDLGGEIDIYGSYYANLDYDRDANTLLANGVYYGLDFDEFFGPIEVSGSRDIPTRQNFADNGFEDEGVYIAEFAFENSAGVAFNAPPVAAITNGSLSDIGLLVEAVVYDSFASVEGVYYSWIYDFTSNRSVLVRHVDDEGDNDLVVVYQDFGVRFPAMDYDEDNGVLYAVRVDVGFDLIEEFNRGTGRKGSEPLRNEEPFGATELVSIDLVGNASVSFELSLNAIDFLAGEGPQGGMAWDPVSGLLYIVGNDKDGPDGPTAGPTLWTVDPTDNSSLTNVGPIGQYVFPFDEGDDLDNIDDLVGLEAIPVETTGLSILVTEGEVVDDLVFLNREVQSATISGTKFFDDDGDGEIGPGDTRTSGVTIYLDLNGNGVLDIGEPTDVTDGDGQYSFQYDGSDLSTFIAPGVYQIREVAPLGTEVVPFKSWQLIVTEENTETFLDFRSGLGGKFRGWWNVDWATGESTLLGMPSLDNGQPLVAAFGSGFAWDGDDLWWNGGFDVNSVNFLTPASYITSHPGGGLAGNVLPGFDTVWFDFLADDVDVDPVFTAAVAVPEDYINDGSPALVFHFMWDYDYEEGYMLAEFDEGLGPVGDFTTIDYIEDLLVIGADLDEDNGIVYAVAAPMFEGDFDQPALFEVEIIIDEDNPGEYNSRFNFVGLLDIVLNGDDGEVGLPAGGLAWNPVDGELYLLGYDGVQSLGIDGPGSSGGPNTLNNTLYRVDKATAELTAVGEVPNITIPGAMEFVPGQGDFLSVRVKEGEIASNLDFLNRTVETGVISGKVGLDSDEDGETDGPLAGATVFVDLNGNGILDDGEPTAVTDVNGDFTFAGTPLPEGTYNVVLLPGNSYNPSLPAAAVKGWIVDGGDSVGSILSTIGGRFGPGDPRRSYNDPHRYNLGGGSLFEVDLGTMTVTERGGLEIGGLFNGTISYATDLADLGNNTLLTGMIEFEGETFAVNIDGLDGTVSEGNPLDDIYPALVNVNGTLYGSTASNLFIGGGPPSIDIVDAETGERIESLGPLVTEGICGDEDDFLLTVPGDRQRIDFDCVVNLVAADYDEANGIVYGLGYLNSDLPDSDIPNRSPFQGGPEEDGPFGPEGSQVPVSLYIVDFDTLEATLVGEVFSVPFDYLTGVSAVAMAWNPGDGELYATARVTPTPDLGFGGIIIGPPDDVDIRREQNRFTDYVDEVPSVPMLYRLTLDELKGVTPEEVMPLEGVFAPEGLEFVLVSEEPGVIPVTIENGGVYDLSFGAALAGTVVIYVDGDDDRSSVDKRARTSVIADGTSWDTAFPTIQEALTAAPALLASPDFFRAEIWVTEGTYSPGPDPTSTYMLIDNVSLYGGFGGFEGSRSQADPDTFVTTLNGDGTNQSIVTGINVGGNTTIGGFIISGGNANGTTAEGGFGGAIYLQGSTVTLEDLWLVENSAVRNGGGVFATGSNVTMRDVYFLGNNSSHSGGGASFDNRSTIIMENVLFNRNTARLWGGAVAFSISNGRITNGIFFQNSALRGGGAVYQARSFATYLSTAIGYNYGGDPNNMRRSRATGGGVYGDSRSGATFHNSVVYFNEAFIDSNLYFARRANVSVRYSTIEGGWNGGTNVLDTDPLWAMDTEWPLTPLPESPLLGAGTATMLPPADFTGAPRTGNDIGPLLPEEDVPEESFSTDAFLEMGPDNLPERGPDLR